VVRKYMEKSNAKKIEMQVESIEEVKFEDVKKSFADLLIEKTFN
jgi:hypothetical protein